MEEDSSGFFSQQHYEWRCVYSNSATNSGEIFLSHSHSNNISGSVYNNTAVRDGGGIFLYYSCNNTMSVSVYSNSAANNGGGYFWNVLTTT